MLIAETNWLENIALAQDSAAAYLLDMADAKKIEIAVPEYSFYEADGALNRKLIKREIKKVLDEIKVMVRVIPYTSDASARAEMIFESASPPFKEGDCRIYASILMFVEHIKEECDLIMFYTEDKEDFDHPKIRDEVRDLCVEIVFESGMCVKKMKGRG
jgi:hypothetical protein